MEILRNGGRSWPSLQPGLTWIYSGTVSVICTAGGLAAVIAGYEGWKPGFVNIGQKNFVRFSFFLGIILIMFVMVWNLTAILFIKMSHQLDDLLRSRQEPRQSPQSHFRSYKRPKRLNFSQISGLLMLGMLLICILLELAGTGYMWYVFVQVSKVHDRQYDNPIVNFCDAKYEKVVCQEAYQQFKGWFHIFRIMLPLLAVLQLPAFLVNCFSWVLVDLESAHPLSPVHKPDNASVSYSFTQPHDPINYYGNLTLPERPQPIGQELTPKLATAGTRGLSHKPVCVPCPKAPLSLQVPGHCSASRKLENKLRSPGLGSQESTAVTGSSPGLGSQVSTPVTGRSQVSTAVTGSPRGIIYHESSPCLKNGPQRFRSFRTQLKAAHQTCHVTSNQIEDRLGVGDRVISLEINPQLVNPSSFSSTNYHHSALPFSTKPSSNSPRNILTNGVLTKVVVLQKTQFPRSKLPSPPPPPTGSRRWTTNQVAFSTTDPELLRKVAQDKKYAGLSRFKPFCTIENI